MNAIDRVAGAPSHGGMSKAELLHVARNIARNTGWPVFPLGDDKKPAIGKREGGRGFHDASTDPADIRRLFSHPRAALIGIPTGERSGFDALDVDVKHASARAWLAVAADHIPPTRTYQTRSGGFHLLFRHAPGVHNTESALARGVDTRGDGGYIVFWFAAGLPCTDNSPAADWPEWLLEALFYQPEPAPEPPRRMKAYASSGTSAQNMVDASLRRLRTAAEGSRHHTLRAAACTLGGLLDAAGMSRAEAADHLLHAVLEAGGNRVDRANAKATIAWGLDKGARSPLNLEARHG